MRHGIRTVFAYLLFISFAATANAISISPSEGLDIAFTVGPLPTATSITANIGFHAPLPSETFTGYFAELYFDGALQGTQTVPVTPFDAGGTDLAFGPFFISPDRADAAAQPEFVLPNFAGLTDGVTDGVLRMFLLPGSGPLDYDAARSVIRFGDDPDPLSIIATVHPTSVTAAPRAVPEPDALLLMMASFFVLLLLSRPAIEGLFSS